MNNPLKDRISVVTGASAGIGEAIARELVALGSAVVINARRRERLDSLATELAARGGRVATLAGDCTQQATIDQLLDTAKARFGREADLIVVNAGRGLSGSPLTSDDAQWEEMIRLNLTGAARLIRAAAQRMLTLVPDGGDWRSRPRDIVILGSTVGKHISPFSSMYGSTKFAINSIAEAVRRELAPKGIRVASISPAIVRSEFQAVAGYDPQKFGAFMDSIGPVLEPSDVARLLGFMVSQPAHVEINDVVIRPTRQDYP